VAKVLGPDFCKALYWHNKPPTITYLDTGSLAGMYWLHYTTLFTCATTMGLYANEMSGGSWVYIIHKSPTTNQDARISLFIIQATFHINS